MMAHMWWVFGGLAIITAIANVVLYMRGKSTEILRFISISLTALTVCSFYSMDLDWVMREDWSALMDVVPTTVKICWGGAIASIIINGITLIKRK